MLAATDCFKRKVQMFDFSLDFTNFYSFNLLFTFPLLSLMKIINAVSPCHSVFLLLLFVSFYLCNTLDCWISFKVSCLMYLDTRSCSSLLKEHTCPSTMCQEAWRLSGWLTVARPAVLYGPVPLALMPAHLPELTCSLPHHLSRRTKCAVVSWQNSLKCQPGVTNPCRPLALTRLVVWGSALDQIGSQEHATVTTTADRLLGRYHLVQGG